MEHRVLRLGNAYARIVRGGGAKANEVRALLPMDPASTTAKQNADLSISYVYRSPSGGQTTFDPNDVLHLRSFSLDGISGVSRVDLAKEAIGLALQAERATARVFKNGSFVDGVLTTSGRMSQEAYDRLKTSWAERNGGADNAGKTPLLEEGADYKVIAQTAKDAQSIETRKMQVEEVARVFGVPRPLLMVDETSWGSGIEALGQFFVTYALQPEFSVWEQGVERSLLKDSEKDTLAAKFNPAALLHGSMADQAAFLANALGSGGHAPWMTPAEVRDLLDLPEDPRFDYVPATPGMTTLPYVIGEMYAMPNVAASAVSLLYGDMASTYLVIDRQGTRVLRDPYTNKPFVQFYTTKRVGGGLLNPDPMRAMVISA